MYTKTKSEKEKIKRAQPVTDEVIRVYCEKMQISRRDFNDWTSMFGDSAWDEVKEFQKLIEQ
jgi:hypothetical protein